jgi:hypothetical protein
MDPSALAAKTAFEKLFRRMAPERHRYEVFRDFVTLSACALHNGFWKEPKREAEYMTIIAQYKPADQKVFPELFAHLVAMLEPEPRDMLGPLYMEMEVASRDQGQFFTPPEISEMMARIQGVDKLLADGRPFITLSEPACGAGGMVLAVVKTLIGAGYNPAHALWVQGWDIDRLAALMAYVQLSLWNVPAEIVVGNTLSLEIWHTPAHHLGFWSSKLAAEPRLTPKRPEAAAKPLVGELVSQTHVAAAQSAPAPKAHAPAEAATPPTPADPPADPPAAVTQLSFDL